MSTTYERMRAAQWVTHNPLTATYETPDGTCVAAELVESQQCLADVFQVCAIRDEQRTDRIRGEGK